MFYTSSEVELIMEAELSEGDINDLLRIMSEVSSYWEHIGSCLGLSTNTIREIKQDNNNTKERFRDMLVRKQKDGLTKNALLKALDESTEIGATVRLQLDKNIRKWKASYEIAKVPSTLAGHNLGTTQSHVRNIGTTICEKISRLKPSIVASNVSKSCLTYAFGFGIIMLAIIVLGYISISSKKAFAPLPLPSEKQDLIGRKNDMHTIENLLLKTFNKTIFITGPPGVGKSAVAITVGHKLNSSKAMRVMYVDMETTENLEKVMIEAVKHEDVEDWASKLFTKTLIILDNCDKHTNKTEQLKELYKLVTLWTQATSMLQVIITNQVKVAWITDKMYTVSLDFLSTTDSKILLKIKMEKSGLEISTQQVNEMQDTIQGMPLAVTNIVQYFKSSTSPGWKNLISNLKKANQAIAIFSSKYLVHATHTVSKSIALAFNTLQEEDKKCGWHLANQFKHGAFYGAPAATAIKNEMHPNTDFQKCLENLLAHQVLISRRKVEVAVKDPDCMVNGTKFFTFCNNQEDDRVKYQFHPLIRSYIIVYYKEKRKRRSPSGSSIITLDWQHFRDTGLGRTYCPDQYMLVSCGTAWSDAKNGMLNKMQSTRVEFKERVNIGVLATYWTRVIFRDTQLNDNNYPRNFISSTLNLKEWKLQDSQAFSSTPDLLTAFVFYNHESLHIKWVSRNGQHQCYCPDPKPAVKLLMSRKKYVEGLYAHVSSNHVAWSARRSFNLDLFCCCRVLGECEHRWEYWIKGVVGQIATAKMFFQHDLRDKCNDNITNLPQKVPIIIEGLWHYSFTKENSRAAQLLEKYVATHTDCPILKLAAVMVLHDIYHGTENEEKDVLLSDHIIDSSGLIDTHIDDYEHFYFEVIIPFLQEIGKSKVAMEMIEILNSQQLNDGQVAGSSFECRLLYEHHYKNYNEFFCLTL